MFERLLMLTTSFSLHTPIGQRAQEALDHFHCPEVYAWKEQASDDLSRLDVRISAHGAMVSETTFEQARESLEVLGGCAVEGFVCEVHDGEEDYLWGFGPDAESRNRAMAKHAAESAAETLIAHLPINRQSADRSVFPQRIRRELRQLTEAHTGLSLA